MRWKVVESYPDSALEAEWEAFLERAAFAGHYVTPGYFNEPFWRESSTFAVLALDGHEVTAVATGLNEDGALTCGMEVRPQVVFRRDGDHRAAADALYRGLLEKAEGEASLVTLNSWVPVERFEELGFRGHPSEGEFRVVVLDLSRGAEALFADFSESRRSNLHKAMREKDVAVSELTTEEELRQLYQIHLSWSEAKGQPPVPWDVMQQAEDQRDYRRIFVAKHGDRVIAGSFYRFCRGGLVEYAANNSLPEFWQYKPNDLLMWRAIEWACEEGFSRFSMGGSHTFLQRFGGETLPTYRYTLDLSLLGRHDKLEAVKGLALRAYRSLPDPVRNGIKAVMKRG